jgi:hypothetical protein
LKMTRMRLEKFKSDVVSMQKERESNLSNIIFRTSYSNETINNIIQADPVIDYKMVIEQKLKTIEELNNKISLEIAKIVICEPCRRKFANKSHYIRHVTLSEIHKNKI